MMPIGVSSPTVMLKKLNGYVNPWSVVSDSVERIEDATSSASSMPAVEKVNNQQE
jgi:hypothetical protein